MDAFKTLLLVFICFFSGIILYARTASLVRVLQSRSSWIKTIGRISSFCINYGTPSISYTYEVQGKAFTGNKFTPGALAAYTKGPGISFPKSFYVNENGQLRFSPGSSIDVFYNPNNPADSALVREMSSGRQLLVVVPIIAVLGAAYLYPEWFSANQLILLPSFFIVGGLLTFIYATSWIRRHFKVLNFPSVKGTLTNAEVVYSSSGGSDGPSGYTASVNFEYKVDGYLYRSQQLRDVPLTILTRQVKDAKLLVDKLKSNPNLEVIYDPQAPWDGFLERSSLLGALTPICISIPFLGMGIFLLYRNFHI